MELNELKNNDGAHKGRMRIGRGIGSGKGKTGGRGYKGQTSRTGVAIKGFEGGQMPIHRRLPKRGFTNHNRKEYEPVNLSCLQKAIDNKKLDAAKPVNVETLAAAGLVRANADAVKLLAKGELKAKVQLEVHKASKAAMAAVEKAGGSVSLLEKTEAAA